MVRGRWFISPHAVRRFIRRYYRGRTFEEALDRLIDLCEDARYIKPAHDGDMYRLPRHGCSRARIIVGKSDLGPLDVVVTVL